MSTLPGFIFPGDVSASARYWQEDIIEPEVKVTNDGTIVPSEAPGIGFRVRTEKIEEITTRKEQWI
jgi:o-succinylbenzoate synthase